MCKLCESGPSSGCDLDRYVIFRKLLGGRVSKYVTNGSKTAVIDVIGFLYISLGSSTVHIHGSLGSRRTYAYSDVGFSSQNGNRG
jgi:hypothetical protein